MNRSSKEEWKPIEENKSAILSHERLFAILASHTINTKIIICVKDVRQNR